MSDDSRLSRRAFLVSAAGAAAAAPAAASPGTEGLLHGGRSGQHSYDVVIYGGSPAGLCAAVQAARLDRSVAVIAPRLHIGGMITAGLTRTDIGHPGTTGGLCREFFDRVQEFYDARDVERQSYWHLEPSVAGRIFEGMLDEAGDISIFRRARLSEVWMDGRSINAVTCRLHDGRLRRFDGKVFIDATYQGDLAARAGAPYLLGRESTDQFGEPHALDEPDELIQAYCFRLTVAKDPANRVPIAKPEGYNPSEFELLAEYVNRHDVRRFVDDCLFAKGPVRGKYDGNAQWHCWVSTDWAEINVDYPEGSWQRRAEIYREYRRRTLSWFYFLQHDPSVPQVLRENALQWGLAGDEHRDTDHIPFMLYIREARRILGQYVFKEMDATEDVRKRDSIGCGGYTIDSHQVLNYDRGNIHLDVPPGNVRYPVNKGYQIPYRILVPRRVKQLLVSVCVSSTHLGYGTLRMEPEYMKMGQAAGAAAALSIEAGVPPAEIAVPKLQELLSNAGVILEGGASVPAEA